MKFNVDLSQATACDDGIRCNRRAQVQTLLDVMPFGSTLVAYAALAGEPSLFNPRTLIGEDKETIGFYLADWMAKRGLARTLRDIARVQRLIGIDLQRILPQLRALGISTRKEPSRAVRV